MPDSLIQPPEVVVAPVDTLAPLTQPPTTLDSLGLRRPALVSPDSLRGIPFLRAGESAPAPSRPPATAPGAARDTTRVVSPVDSTRVNPPAPRDTTRVNPPGAPRDTTGRRP